MKYLHVLVIAHEEDRESVRFEFNKMTADQAVAAAREDFRLEWESDEANHDHEPPEVFLDFVFASQSPIETPFEL